MPTDSWFKDNPKVSAYISKALEEQLKQFKKTRKISISQALTIILSEYFGVDQEVDQIGTSSSLDRIQELDQRITSLSKLVDQKFAEIEKTIKLFSLLLDQSNLINSLGEKTIQSGNELQSKPEKKEEVESVDMELFAAEYSDRKNSDEFSSTELDGGNTVLISELKGRLPDKKADTDDTSQLQESDIGLPFKPNSKPIDEKSEEPSSVDDREQIFAIQPLSASELGRRLGVSTSVVSRYKSGKRKQTLSEWSAGIDPSGVVWEYSEEKKLYIPVDQNKEKSNLKIELLKTQQ